MGSRPGAEWLADYAWRIDDVRVALDWAFSTGRNASIGVTLTAAAVPLWDTLVAQDPVRPSTTTPAMSHDGR